MAYQANEVNKKLYTSLVTILCYIRSNNASLQWQIAFNFFTGITTYREMAMQYKLQN